MTDLDAKAQALAQARDKFTEATELLKDGHKLLGQCGENNCKTKQWSGAATKCAALLTDVASRALTATKRAKEVMSGKD